MALLTLALSLPLPSAATPCWAVALAAEFWLHGSATEAAEKLMAQKAIIAVTESLKKLAAEFDVHMTFSLFKNHFP
ncbi:exported protein of unknown function [Shewanella benthica]|uniref:Secreted protein n=1 Tax=Shewanella benthica TaxID=43661 RepID=A0A330M5B1_9GAMM|nr:exported protein of unknown function [Shewanella benthica]